MPTIDELTREEKVLLYLFIVGGKGSDMEASMGRTQNGIAEAVGFRRTHATRTLDPLIDKGLLIRKKCHIEGAVRNRKMWAYALSENGRMEARRILARYGLKIDDIRRWFSIGRDAEGNVSDPVQIMAKYDITREDAEALISITGGKSLSIEMILSSTYPGEADMAPEERYLYRYMKLKEAGKIR